jgi:hypothetical protein
VHALLQRRVGDADRGEADALVNHLDAGFADRYGNLRAAVAVVVEAGLADQPLRAADVCEGKKSPDPFNLLLAHRLH